MPTFFGNKYNVAGFLSFLGQIKTTLLPLIGKYPGLNIAIEFDLGRAWGSGHYNHLAFEVVSPATNGSRQGEWVDIMDGGSVDRSRRLLSDNKEKALVGGFGTDYLANYFLVNGK